MNGPVDCALREAASWERLANVYRRHWETLSLAAVARQYGNLGKLQSLLLHAETETRNAFTRAERYATELEP